LVALLFAGLTVVSAAWADEYRTWTDSTGVHTLRAKFESLEDGKAILVREDGQRQKIAIEKLSKADQEFIAKQGSNPFESADNETAKPTDKVAAPVGGGPRVVKVDWADAQQILLESGDAEWKVAVPGTPAGAFRPKSVPLPGKTDFFEGLTGMAFSQVAKTAVLGYTLSGPNKPVIVRLVACDLASGRVKGQATLPEEKWAPLALHDDGRQILMRSADFGHGKSNRLEIWTIEGKGVARSLAWTPYTDGWEPHRDVAWAEFIDAKRLATCSSGGKLAIWNLATAQPICYMQTEPGSTPCLSADRKLLAVASKAAMGLLDVEKLEMLCSQKLPRETQSPCLAFSPSGRRIGCIAGEQVLVWDTATGSLEKDFRLAGLRAHFKSIAFPDDEFVLLNGSFLIELKNQLKLWEYKGASHVRTAGETTLLAILGDAKAGLLMATQLPHPEATALLEKAIQQPDLFVFHKGTPVSLDVSNIPDAAERDKAADLLTKKLGAMNCPIQPTAEVSVVAFVEGPKEESVSFLHSGTYNVTRYQTGLKIVYAGQSLWQESWTNIPGIVRVGPGENLGDKLREASAKPSYGFYEKVVLPEFLQKPSSDTATAGASQTLGATQLTAQSALTSPAPRTPQSPRSRRGAE
jgi:hypothetical protein